MSELVRETMLKMPQPVVDKQALLRLDALEKERAQDLGVGVVTQQAIYEADAT